MTDGRRTLTTAVLAGPVVVAVVGLLLDRVRRPVLEIRAYGDEIAVMGGRIQRNLVADEQLQRLAAATAALAGRTS